MTTATATSIGSAMLLAYAYGGRAPVVLSESDDAERGERAMKLPAYATCVVYASETHYTVHAIQAGRIAEPCVVIHLAGDALSDLSL